MQYNARELRLPDTCAMNKTSRAETSSFVSRGNAAFDGACCLPSAGKDRSTDDALLRLWSSSSSGWELQFLQTVRGTTWQVQVHAGLVLTDIQNRCLLIACVWTSVCDKRVALGVPGGLGAH